MGKMIVYLREFEIAESCLPCLLLIAVMLGLALSAPAQSARGTITGIVKDPSGAVVPGVDISITNKDNGVVTQATSTDAGVYRVPYLSPGKYRITASLTGFKTAVADNVDVLIAETVTVDFRLEIGQVSEQVTVVAHTPLLEASTPEIGINSTEKEVHTWPIIIDDGTRQLQTFIFTSLPGSEGKTFHGAINGGQAYSHEILFDGISVGRMDLNGGNTSEFTATMDAVSEFKLQTGALSSQYGNTQTALANFGLKSGTNDYHGTLFWFHRNKSLNANSWSNNAFGRGKSPFLDNNFGATFGGPIRVPGLYNGKDRTHFFLSYEGDRFNNQTVSGSRNNMPIPAFRHGDFSRLLDPAFTGNANSGKVIGKDVLGRDVIFGQIYDPTTSRQAPNGVWVRDPFPGNIIPQNKMSRVSLNVLKHDIPNPQFDTFLRNALRVSSGQPILDIDNVSFKLDHVLSKEHQFALSYISNDRSRLKYNGGYRPVGTGIPGPAAVGDRTQATPGHIIRFSEDWTISPTKLNHYAFGYNRFRNANQSNSFLSGVDWATELGMTNVGKNAFPIIRFAGFSTTLSGGYGQLGDGGTSNEPNGSTILQDDFTWLRGKHSFRFGAEHRRYYLNSRSVDTAGTYTFHSENTALTGFMNQTGFAYASFLAGAVNSAGLGIHRLTPGVRSRTTAFYVQDDWKVTSNLTLNVGLRWDIPTPLTETASRMSGLNPTKPNPGANNYLGAFEVLGDCAGCSGRTSFADIYWKEFGPRVGFAYAHSSKLVVRGGYGINYSPPLQDGFDFPYTEGFDGSNPIIARRGRFREDPSYVWDNPYPPYTKTLPNTDPSLLNGSDIGYYLPQTNKYPKVQNWNVGVQYELPWQTKLEVNYVGNHGDRLKDNYLYSLNQVNPKFLSLGDTLLDDIAGHPEIKKPFASFDGTVARALRPFPQYEGVTTHRLNDGYSNYHALQITATKRSTYGLGFIAAYTFSKALGNADDAIGYGYGFLQDFHNRKADYSVTSFHVPQHLKLTWIYDLPVGPQAR